MIYSFDDYNDPDLSDNLIQKYSRLSDEEINRIREYGDSLDKTSVKLYGKFDETHVNASGSHFPYNDETSWIYDKMADIGREINKEHFKYDLTGFRENFYYLRYQSPVDHFNWHVDIGGHTPSPRKLSLVLQLSDPSEYEGGEFDVLVSTHHERGIKAKGIISAFPSYKIHRVTPVTSGIRRTLTMFLVGPNFR